MVAIPTFVSVVQSLRKALRHRIPEISPINFSRDVREQTWNVQPAYARLGRGRYPNVRRRKAEGRNSER